MLYGRRKIGILFALREEEAGFVRVMAESRACTRRDGPVTRWYIGGIELLVCVSGVGRELTTKAAGRLVECGVDSVICAGFAAALDPNAKVGDVFVANRILLEPACDHAVFHSTPLMASIIPPHSPRDFAIRHSDLVTTDRVIRYASEKRDVFRATGAAVLDMESYAAAKVCTASNIPYVVLRSISDPADQELPPLIETLIDLPSQATKALLAIAKPGLWMPLFRLRGQAKKAAANLGDTLGMVVLRLI